MDKIYPEEHIQAIANAIRRKNGRTVNYLTSEMAGAIDQLVSYPEPTGTQTITENGIVDVKDKQYADVNVPQPSGNINITDMQSTDVSAYATAQVVDADLVAGNIKKDVDILGVVGTYEGSGGATLISKSITVNGTYDAEDDNADGYSDVTVNVPNSYVAADEGKVVSNGALVAQTSVTKTQNGTYDTTLNNEVVINVSGGGGSTNILSGTDAPTANQGSDGSIYLRYLKPRVKNTQQTYIDTGVSVNSSLEYEVEFITHNKISNSSSYSYGNNYGCIFGARNGANSAEFQLSTYATSASNVTASKGTQGFGSTRTAVYINPKNYQKISLHNGVITDNEGDTYAISGSFSDGKNLYLFALNDNGTAKQYGILELMTLKIWDSGVLVRDYSAAENNGTACLYDAVNDEYVTPDSGALVYDDTEEICQTYCKVNGAWQNLVGTDIDDVNTGGGQAS